ncbi:prolyl oligopeptidase family serine peptidase [Fimbriimonas ginsengisoli]|uniref:Prolyl oligopeptidase n=1 Tax=Fimbriimonas ginsengisoli Gsoil 348 TaxID=661478 RepID=A0A068NM35_FIMGI|nr:prolyl oligopeptidase family serine peptidase [Fimbriimonas ginsengisoli]AIE84531.1 Prolyl oligopeptidase [Fimbriimonas ginsengisoli Gsoil 348]
MKLPTLGLLLLTTSTLSARQGSTVEQVDKYQWLEDVWGKRSLDWVKAENARSAKVLESDPRFAKLQAEALKIVESPDRLPDPTFRNGMVYNTWQDHDHPQGILRRTTLADYTKAKPHWKTVLDYDALSKKDHQKWVHGAIVSLYPNDNLSMIGLSAGGEDANTLREFDLKSGRFVAGGFVLPRSKQSVAWIDRNTLMVMRDWGKGTMTASGYPFVAKVWKRGTPLSQAKEVYRGTPADVAVDPLTLSDTQGHRVTFLIRALDFFRTQVSLWSPGKVRRLAIPQKSQIEGLLDNRLIVTLNEDWKQAGLKQGSVVALDLDAARRDPAHLKPTLIFAPTQKEFAQQVGLTRHRLILATMANVQGRAYVFTPQLGGVWTRKKLAIRDNQAVSIVTTNEADDKFFLSVESFITPSTLLLGDASRASLVVAKTRRPQFDASRMVVEQLEATSSDGGKIPYFVVHKKGIRLDGSNPTLLEAYGGFQISSTPFYSGVVGKLWLERGGVYALANIRGGGEFGPAWHEAGLKTHRQIIYDDFAAVGQDLVTRKITSPRRLGIEGGSNGGLLMGVEMTQHPEMWNAVVIDIPLLDMLRFEKIAAGASWVGEYGSVSNPEERRFLASISPYNQLNPDTAYPEPLIFTTTKDDRVGPVHARKFAARMKEFHKPFFYNEIVEGGHSSGANLKEKAKTNATTFIYLIRKLMD